MTQIICIGSSSKDIFFPTDEGIIIDTPEDLTSQKKIAFELGAKFHVEKRYEALGGCAANVCSGLKKLGIDSLCYTTVGDDLIGRWIIGEFEKQNIKTSLISVEKDCASDLSAIVVDKKSADRIIFSNQIANTRLKVDKDKIGSPEWIFIGDLNGDWKENLKKITTLASQENIKTAFNPRQKTIHDDPQAIIGALKNCRVLILNKDEAIEIISTADKNLSQKELNSEEVLIKKLKNLGPEVVALTDGMRGAWAYNGRSLIYARPVGENPVETTGAGDAFSSGFLAAIVRGKNVEEALRWGIANSGNSVKFYGAIQGLLTETEINSRISEVKVEFL